MTMVQQEDEEEALATPLLSRGAEDGAPLVVEEAVWDIVFDKEETIGLQTHNNNNGMDSTRILAVQAGSQAESLGIAQQLRFGSVYIIAVGGKPVYNIKDIRTQVGKCRHDSHLTARALVFTLSRQPLSPPPVCKLCWACTKQMVRCVPTPNRQILTRKDKFLGLVGPAQQVQRCGCCPYFVPACIKMKIRLETIVCLLAWFLLLKALIVFIGLALICDAEILAMTNINYVMAQAVVEGGLALYVLSGMVTRRSWALQRFALMLFVVTVASVTASLVQFIGLAVGDPLLFSEDWPWLLQWLVMLVLGTALKLYIMWTAWSLAIEYKKEKRDDDDDNNNDSPDSNNGPGQNDYIGPLQHQGQEDISERHDEESGSISAAGTTEDSETSNDEESASFSLA